MSLDDAREKMEEGLHGYNEVRPLERHRQQAPDIAAKRFRRIPNALSLNPRKNPSRVVLNSGGRQRWAGLHL